MVACVNFRCGSCAGTILLAAGILPLHPIGGSERARLEAACSDPVRAAEWVEELQPMFSSTEPEHAEFRLRTDLERVDPATSPIGVVSDHHTCASISAEVIQALDSIPFFQTHSYELMMVQFGPYFAVAVDEVRAISGPIVWEGRTLVLVLDASSFEILVDNILL